MSRRLRALLAAVVAQVGLAVGCSAFLPDAPLDENLLDGPLDGLTSAQLRSFAAGDEEFNRVFSAAEGVGPIFVAQSCGGCHVGDGKGHPAFNLTRFGRMTAAGFDQMPAHGGPQLQHRALPAHTPERIPASATGVAVFTAPAVTGLGFLEAVEDSTLVRLADEFDADGDGISGRLQLLDPSDFIAEIARLDLLFEAAEPQRHLLIDGKYIGRFGKKAGTINLLQQTVTAYREDMGLTTDLIPLDPANPQGGSTADDVPDPEVGSGTVANVVFYLKTLRHPPRRNADAVDVRAGEAIFTAIGCARCHLPVLRTGPSRIGPLDRVEFRPYTDLLLHDMGPDLDDGYTEGRATTAEWRTAPLWGLGLAEGSQGRRTFFLHDGRATTIEQAIEYHGGEAAASRAGFRALPAADAARLIAFLRSL